MVVALADVAPEFYRVQNIAAKLQISTRQVWRLHDAGLMPQAIKIGRRAVRWNRALIDEWIIAGCPPCRKER
jgi:predicted DNA-binding transcriptional regulator AlpA